MASLEGFYETRYVDLKDYGRLSTDHDFTTAGEVLFADVLLLPNGMSKVGFTLGYR
jgi:hypothetical protein